MLAPFFKWSSSSSASMLRLIRQVKSCAVLNVVLKQKIPHFAVMKHISLKLSKADFIDLSIVREKLC